MFAKPFRVKSNSQLKGSERKKLRAELLQNFPSLTDENVQELIPNKEVISLAKILTHGGELVLVYSVQKLPIVFQLESVMYPTVYMLWKVPYLIHYFTTWSQVLPKITGGADLMLPGLVLKDGFNINAFGKLEKGTRVAVNLSSNKAAIAVGKAALSSMDMYMAARRGRAVNILHYVSDELWSYGTKLTLPELGPPDWIAESAESDEMSDTVPETAAEKNDTSQNSPPDVDATSSDPSQTATNDLGAANFSDSEDLAKSLEDDVGENEASNQALREELKALTVVESKESMDDLVQYCFFKSLNTTAKKVDYPMLASKFYKLHMLPACPTGKSIDIKRSSYRKLSAFLNQMNELGVVNVKELTKGVESIMSVNPTHPLLRNFVDNEVDPLTEDPSQMIEVEHHVSPSITEMYIVTAAVLPLLIKYDLKKGTSIPATTVKKHLTEYVKAEQLQDPKQKRMVRLNPLLSLMLKDKTATEYLSWDELMSKVLSCMTRSYSMSFSGQNTVLTKGKLEPIDIQVGKRTGNKKVTLINNLELYGINLAEFARECQHGVAASTSISSVPGKKSAQLMVQGNQVLFVGNLIQGKYQIPKRYIRGLENAPKPKK